ncbi:uncharacterized protein J4E78_001672 [Alternaria triticimaculans]|uniref:uncharacterized protein n=1 Tax=Alternaria triticimaculans TaxID=297637 RepID=UPI0020C44041|nr:uncharacterized protein J4E78_001672 [Alternaria triticimaculans]KAI4673165.1 hypothetical protein J4E78_001672 [Alternaria triticimaculans]
MFGGSIRLVGAMINASLGDLQLRSEVVGIEHGQHRRYKLSLSDASDLALLEDREFDVVVLAGLVHESPLLDSLQKLGSLPKNLLSPPSYTSAHVTYFATEHAFRPEYLNLSADFDIPDRLLTTSAESSLISLSMWDDMGFYWEDRLRRKEPWVERPDHYDSDECGNRKFEYENLYRIASLEYISEGKLAAMIGKDWEEGQNATDIGFSWIHRQEWSKAFAEFDDGRGVSGDIQVAEGVFWLGGGDEVTSSLEMSCNMGRNVASLIQDRATTTSAGHGELYAQNVGIETTPIFKNSQCSAEQERIIRQAWLDGVMLANAAFDDSDELLPNTGGGHKIINFDTRAAIEYWGPPSENLGYRQRIYDTFYRATQASWGRGWADWWFERYIEMHCDDPEPKQCDDSTSAYYMPTKKGSWTYDGINFCPAFFSTLKDHAELEKRIIADPTGQLRLNTRNMRSRGHDTKQMIGGKAIFTYKSGRAKLLAARDVQAAAETNDNYVYFAIARYMQKKFGVYPAYPRIWSPEKTKAENQAIENGEPGAPSRYNMAFELEDVDLDGGASEAISDKQYKTSIYPEWYQQESPVEPDFGRLAFSHPNIDDVVCQTTSESAQYDDCVAAFATLEGLDRNKVQLVHKRPGERWWPNAVTTCAVQVHYKGDWSKCEASLSDVWAHAKDVFEGCHGEYGTVGGYVPFGVPNCPATIDLVSSRQWSNPDPF